MRKALVPGGAGFIGSHLVRRLLASGWTVRVLDDLSSGHRHNLEEVWPEFEFIEGDIRDAQTIGRACAGVEVIFHLAALGSVPRSVKEPLRTNDVNVNGTLTALVAARDAGARRFVFSASSSAYGDTPVMPKVESMTPHPLSPYAVSKLTGEQYCSVFSHVYGLETVSLRYFNVFGPRQDPASNYAAAIPAFVGRMLAGQRPIVFGDGEQSRDFCYVDNVVTANLLAADAPGVRGEAVNIACGERTTLNRIIELINGHLGTSLAPIHEPPRPGDVRHSLAGLERARALLGYEPRILFAEGLERSIGWYREHLRPA